MLRFPVTCPVCNNEVLSALRVAELNLALTSKRPIRLFASCHNRYWDASELETQQIRQYLEVVPQAGQRRLESQ